MSPTPLQILAYEETPLGILCLRKRELLREPGTFVTEVTLNHEFLMSSYNTQSERALAAMALEMCAGKDLSVLVGGLGLGYTAAAALKSERVKRLQVMEFLPQVIEWLNNDLIPLSSVLCADKRLEVVQADFFGELSSAPKAKYDLILVDIDHSPNEPLSLESSNETFYTEVGLREAKAHLTPGGILGVWSYAECSPFAEAMKNVFSEVRVKDVSFENKLINETETDWLFFGRNDQAEERADFE